MSGDLGHLRLMSSAELHASDDNQRLVPGKLLHIGSAMNGDLLVLDFTVAVARPGFVSHDEFWSDDTLDPRACLQPIARSFASLLWRLSEGRYVPGDYSAAVAFHEFLAEEQRFSGGAGP